MSAPSVESEALVHLSIVLDLSLLVPLYVACCVLLWRRAAWGYVLAAIALVSGIVQQIGYMVALPFQSARVPGASAFDPYEPVITLAYVVGALLLLGPLLARRANSRR